MDEINWEAILSDEDTLLKATALAYIGVGLYFGLKKKPIRKREPVREVQPRPEPPRSLSEMIAKMIEETYGIQRE